jgi:hypothetical protein
MSSSQSNYPTGVLSDGWTYNFFLGDMITGWLRSCRGTKEVKVLMAQAEINLDSLIHRCLHSLKVARWCESISADFLEINGRGNNFDIVQAELGALSHDRAIDHDERCTIVEKPVSIRA